jgi:hypothetical protein
MSQPALKTDPANRLGGTVLISQGSGWMRPTGVFLPGAGLDGDSKLTVLLWFHGYYVSGISHLFYREATKLLSAVLGSKKRLVLIAPHLGWFQTKTQTDYNAGVLGGGKNTETYLDQVLDALYDWHLQNRPDGAAASDAEAPAKFQIADLYLAGHSGGGGGIRNSAGALGHYRDALRECWGFDCLYGRGQSWYEWATTQKGKPLYFYYGQGTKPSDNADVLGFWKLVYGTPRSAPPPGRASNVFLAPALTGTESDSVAFQSADDLRQKAKPANRYEQIRWQVDPLLDDPKKYWPTLVKLGLKGHYQVVSDLLSPRIQQSL